jgi:hypothetical protein
MSYNMCVLCFLCMSVLMLVLLFTCMSVVKALQSLCCMFYTPTLNQMCICICKCINTYFIINIDYFKIEYKLYIIHLIPKQIHVKYKFTFPFATFILSQYLTLSPLLIFYRINAIFYVCIKLP